MWGCGRTGREKERTDCREDTEMGSTEEKMASTGRK